MAQSMATGKQGVLVRLRARAVRASTGAQGEPPRKGVTIAKDKLAPTLIDSSNTWHVRPAFDQELPDTAKLAT